MVFTRQAVLHIVKSLVRLPPLHTLGFVGVIKAASGPRVLPVHRVLRGSFVGHSVISEEHQKEMIQNTVKHTDIKY